MRWLRCEMVETMQRGSVSIRLATGVRELRARNDHWISDAVRGVRRYAASFGGVVLMRGVGIPR
eukprot:581618-Prymnesium_polylepis.2